MSPPDEVNPYQSPESQPAAGVPSASPHAGQRQVTLDELEQRVAALEWRLRGSLLFSSSFLTRALAVFGHWCVVYLLLVVLMIIAVLAVRLLFLFWDPSLIALGSLTAAAGLALVRPRQVHLQEPPADERLTRPRRACQRPPGPGPGH